METPDFSLLKNLIQTNVNAMKAFKEGEAAIEQLENIAQVAKETQERVDTLKAEEIRLNEVLANAQAQIVQAQADAAQVITDANTNAAQVMDDAIMEVERFKADNKLAIDQGTEQLTDLNLQVTFVKDELVKSSAELDRVNGEIEKVKAAIANAFPSKD